MSEDYEVELESAISDLEDAFYPLEHVKTMPKENKHYERVMNALKELKNCHNLMYQELLEIENGKEVR